MMVLEMYELAENLEQFAVHSSRIGHSGAAERARQIAVEVSAEARRIERIEWHVKNKE